VVRKAFERGDRRGKYWAMQSVMMHRPDLRPVLPRLTVPVLMLAGRDDALLDRTEAERAAQSVPGGRFAEVTGAGHVAPLLTAPHEVIRNVLEFWPQQES
jgi:pimeloyl-ACP methyl ester carboxylesterase